jgi:hypothetical protein
MPKKQWGNTMYSNRKPKRARVDLNFDEIIQKNVNPNGRVRSIEENKLLIQAIAYFQKNGMSLDESLKECKIMFGGSYDTYKNLWSHYIETNNLNISETHFKRESGLYKYYDICDLDDDIVDGFLEFAFQYTVSNNTGFSVPDILAYFEHDHSLIIDSSTAHYLLHKYNFCWSQQSVYYGNEYENNRVNELKRFLFQYSHALTLEKNGTHVIVAMDESWANTGTSFDHSWLHICNDSAECIVCNKFTVLANGDAKASIKKANTGKRNVFAHAITRQGLLADEAKNEDEHKHYIMPSFQDLENLELKMKTCEYIIECFNDNSKDYHQQMNFEKFIKYFENRLVYSCNNLNNGKKAIIFIDQCPFHMVSEGFPSTTDDKAKIIDYYQLHKIEEINLRRYDTNNILGPVLTFKSTHFHNNPKLKNPQSGGPSKDELYMYLFIYLKIKNPSALEPVVCKIAKKYNHFVLFSCPYNPNDMPIEYLNSYVKCNVKQRCYKNRTIEQLKVDIRDGFYGGEIKNGLRQHKCVDAHMTNGWFKKCEDNMNYEIYNVLRENNKNIYNLWQQNNEISLNNPWIRVPKTSKTLKKLSEKFIIVIDNVNQSFF